MSAITPGDVIHVDITGVQENHKDNGDVNVAKPKGRWADQWLYTR